MVHRCWFVRVRSIRHCGAACQVNRSSDNAHGRKCDCGDDDVGDGGGGGEFIVVVVVAFISGVISVKKENSRGKKLSSCSEKCFNSIYPGCDNDKSWTCVVLLIATRMDRRPRPPTRTRDRALYFGSCVCVRCNQASVCEIVIRALAFPHHGRHLRPSGTRQGDDESESAVSCAWTRRRVVDEDEVRLGEKRFITTGGSLTRWTALSSPICFLQKRKFGERVCKLRNISFFSPLFNRERIHNGDATTRQDKQSILQSTAENCFKNISAVSRQEFTGSKFGPT